VSYKKQKYKSAENKFKRNMFKQAVFLQLFHFNKSRLTIQNKTEEETKQVISSVLKTTNEINLNWFELMIVSALLIKDSNKAISYSRNKVHYCQMNKKYPEMKSWYTLPNMLNSIDLFDRLDFIELNEIKSRSENNIGSSSILFSNKFYQFIESFDWIISSLNDLNINREREGRGKDNVSIINLNSESLYNSKRFSAPLVRPLPDTNKKTLDNFKRQFKTKKEFQSDIFNVVVTDNKTVHHKNISYWFAECGRLCSSLTNLPKDVRRNNLSIDNEKSIEKDIGACFISMLYDSRRIKKEFEDPYQISNDLERKYWKVIATRIISCRTKNQAIGSLKKAIEEEELVLPNVFRTQRQTIIYFLEQFEKYHQPIKKYFYQGIKWLFVTEGLIAQHVVNKFIQNGKSIIPLYDAFLVAESNEKFLVESMNEAWQTILKTNEKPIIK
jgi:hypothetical protein